MSPRDALVARLARWTGLDLHRGGRGDTLDRVIAQRVRALGHATTDAYVSALGGSDDPEVRRLVDVLTVGHTWFFRDLEQNEAFRAVLAQAPDPLRVWVAGTSTGEEAYTIALLAHEMKRRVHVLGTDINASALDLARAGRYSEWSIRAVPASLRDRFARASDGRWALDAAIRERVVFERHNLIERPKLPSQGGAWNLVACRNVLIYFARDEARRTIERLASTLAPSGWLFLGASEVLHEVPSGFAIGAVGPRFGVRRSRPEDLTRPSAQPAPRAVPDEPIGDMLERALTMVERGQAADAIALVLRVLEREPLLADAHLVTGIAFYTTGDAPRAVEALRAALFLEPDHWVASFYLARAYDALGRGADARSEYARAARSAEVPGRALLRTLEAWRGEMLTLARMRGGV